MILHLKSERVPGKPVRRLMSRLVMQLLLLTEYGACRPVIMHQDQQSMNVVLLAVHYELPVIFPSQ